MKNLTLTLVLICLVKTLYPQDSTYVKVHFLYGSKHRKEFKNEEPKWFGGIHGGHVGIEIDSNTIIDFIPSGKFHVISSSKHIHGKFVIHREKSFWEIFGGESSQMKKATIIIPVSKAQKTQLSRISKSYLSNSPYDYAFIGMRCGSAAYDILSQINILKRYPYQRTYWKIFYPKLLRKRLLKLARENHWDVIRHGGTTRRKWEKD
ncbi:MAG: hypothetical protein IIA45_00485 [Bacteroidetes bacterium]|nr:hypothetical protein [Bacteroidota bacterium]